MVLSDVTKTCWNCKETKDLGEFNRNQGQCRSCQRIYKREWVARNKEHVSRYSAQYYSDNREQQLRYTAEWKRRNRKRATEAEERRRARKHRNGPVEIIDRDALYERDGGRCHICSRLVSRDSFELDHLIPLARGGQHRAVNLAVAHSSCNRKRGNGWLPAQLRLVA